MITRPFYYTTLGADPTNADVVYGGAETFYKSIDGGRTFTTMPTPHGDNHDIWINPNDGRIDDPVERRRRERVVRRRPDLVDADESADVGDLRRLARQPVPVRSTVRSRTATRSSSRAWRIPGRSEPTSSVGRAARRARSCRTRTIRTSSTDRARANSASSISRQARKRTIGSAASRSTAIPRPISSTACSACRRWRRRRTIRNVLYYGSQYVHRTRDEGVTWETHLARSHRATRRAARARAASRSRAMSPARSSTARSTRLRNRRWRRASSGSDRTTGRST